MIRRALIRQIRDYARTFVRPVNSLSGPEAVDTPPGTRVLVLSPHFDDDVIGCGGTLAKHVRAGHPVAVAYMTDGREGDASIPDKDRVSTLRKDEARRATSLLGITNLTHLDEPETKLRSTSNLLERLSGLFRTINPDLVYLPWFLDNHIDHFETNRVLFDLAGELDGSITIAAYEVWMPLVPNIVVDITDVAELKRQALRQYETQVRQIDYVETTLGLNKYRAAFRSNGKGYAEAFFVASLKEYTSMMDALKLSSRLYIQRP